jgi:hypothetical protein
VDPLRDSLRPDIPKLSRQFGPVAGLTASRTLLACKTCG